MRQFVGQYPIDTVTGDELDQSIVRIGHQVDTALRDMYRGVKPIRLPIVQSTATGTSLTIPAGNGAEPIRCGPASGFFWRIGRVTVSSTGSDSGAVSLYAGSDPANLNPQFLVDATLTVGKAYYPGSRGLFLWPGEQLYAAVTSVSANTYRIAGVAIEVPAEFAGKLLV